MSDDIFNVVNNDPDNVYLLIGHSAGADAVILAAYKLINQGMSSKIKGIALLDPYFKDDQLKSLQDRANAVAGGLSGKVFLADTTSDGITVDIPGATREEYPDSHDLLAVDQKVLDAVLKEIPGWK